MTSSHSESPDRPRWVGTPSKSRSATRGVPFPPDIKREQKVKGTGTPKAHDRLYDKVETASILNVSERFVQGLIEGRRIQYVKVGKFVRIPEAAINQFLAEGTREPL